MGLKRYSFLILQSLSLRKIGVLICGVILFASPLQAQDESLELTNASDPSPDTGPVTTTTVTFLYNEDNTGTTFSPYLPQTDVTFSLSNQQYTNVTQDSGNNGGDPSTADSDPAGVIGWTFNTQGGGTEFIYDGAATEINAVMNALSQSIPTAASFSSLETTPNDGIDIGTNTSIFMSVSFEPLRGQTYLDSRYQMVDLTISFSEPVTNPVLHFVGLGGVWERDPGAGTNYINTATMEFELISSSPAVGSLTFSKLSGTDSFEVVDGTKLIRNNSDLPDFEDTPAISSGVGTGSALIEGDDISSLTFRMYARAMTTDGANTANAATGGDPEFGNADWGWAGSGTTDFPDINFSADRFMIGVSAPVQTDDVLLTDGECYRMMSSPVEGTTYATLLDPIWTQGMTGADYTSGDPNVWLWPDTPGEDSGSWQGVSNLNNTIPAGSGFLVSVYADDDYNGSADAFPKTISVKGSENAPLTFSGMNGDATGFTLLGNPFKSTIDFDNLFAETGTQNINNAVYVYDRGTGSFASYTSGSGDLTDGLIAPFQGFFVQNSSTGSQVDFTDAVKSSSTGSFYGKQKELRNFVRFELNGQNLFNSMWVRFSDEGAPVQTNGDALELYPMANEYAFLGTRKEDGTIFDIGNYPIPSEEFEIPVSLETTRSGNYTLTATDMDISFGADLYLIDLVAEKSIRIDKNFSYEFSTEGVAAKAPGGDRFNRCTVDAPKKAKTITANDRFLLSTQPRDFVEIPTTLSLNQNYPNPFNPTTQISYDLPQSADVRLEVFDLVGRQVATLVNQTVEAGAHTVNFNASNLSSGVYIYRLHAGNTVLSRKLTIIK